MQGSHEREHPRQRLEEGTVHVFSTDELGRQLRGEPEYESHRRTGITLMKTDSLRVLLETAEAGTSIESHVVRGAATIYVVEGRLEIETQDRTWSAAAGEMAVLPAGESRRIACRERSVFLMALAPDA